MMQHPLSAWPERRPERSETQRRAIADRYADHLPQSPARSVSDADLDAMRAAFIRRFDETLPRTETLMCVANIGYRMALRDLASGIETEGHDPAEGHGAEHEIKDATNE